MTTAPLPTRKNRCRTPNYAGFLPVGRIYPLRDHTRAFSGRAGTHPTRSHSFRCVLNGDLQSIRHDTSLSTRTPDRPTSSGLPCAPEPPPAGGATLRRRS